VAHLEDIELVAQGSHIGHALPVAGHHDCHLG
jgi:hypothetical protein